MNFPFIPAYHYSVGSNLPINRIVIHGTVSATRPGGARATASYFQNPASGGSAQYIVDPVETIQSAFDDTICWHAPPNQGSIGVEFCDWVYWQQGGQTVADLDPFWAGKTEADFNRRWSLPRWDAMLRRGAQLVSNLASQHSVPVARLSVADLLVGHHGICGHVDVSQAWHQTDHTDPGPTFPWSTFMAYVMGATVGPAPSPQPSLPPHPTPVPGQLVVDGGMGSATISRWQRVMGTPVDGIISQPRSSLVIAVQQRLNTEGAGLNMDGAGIVQDNRRYLTVAALQRHLGTPIDGVLSTPSSQAIKALQIRLNQNRF